MSIVYERCDYGLRVKVERDNNGHCTLTLIMDAETGEFIVSELPDNDEVTKQIAKGVWELVLADVPTSRHIGGTRVPTSRHMGGTRT